MAKVRARADTKKLFIDFRYQEIRCREQTLLSDTVRNRKQLETLIQRMEAKMLVGDFDYAEFFPGSKNLKKLEEAGVLSNKRGDGFEQSESTTPRFPDFADQWFGESKIQWRSSHVRNVTSILESSLKPAFKNKRVGEITKADILAARNKLARRKGRGTSGLMAPKTINSHMTILRMILTEAAERYEFDNPYRNIKPLKLQKVHIEPFSMDEVDKILKHVREDYRIYYLVRFYTGMRTGEVDGLKWEYVDFEKREILVRETLVHGQAEYTKTDGSQREIPMFGPVYDALKEQYEATGKLSKFVFCNRLGESLDHNNVTKRVWYPLLELLKLKKRRPYQTRHTAATLLLASGENPEWVARTLGHSSTEMLFKVYSRYIPNLTRMDGSAFERLIQSRVIENDQEMGNETE
ncbi:tyrosine-type recombinase/integrase [Marinobacter goseongensis]|uniref:tyrosine-type recombinase/integrase n=1 Tax=Marinobacter goseongensis TaxID=453838 RepID=UPI002005290D|nr:tyrosine-type recombinase/integrase [Marinobacter goseongensis]MCK7552959.1 site-specific integrase [Marinobacter goseongensis]